MHRKLTSIALALVTAVLLGTVACVPTAPSQVARAKVRVVSVPFLSFSPIYVAMKEGFFDEQGLDVEIVKFERSSDAFPALAQGDVDVLGSNVTSGLLNAIGRGAHLRIVVDRAYFAPDACTYTAVLARKDLVDAGGLSRPALLKGKRVAVDPETYEGYYFTKILQQGGLSWDDVTVVSLPRANQLQALQDGKIDILAISEPYITPLLQTGKVVIWKPAQEVEPNFQSGFLLYGPSLLEHDAELGNRFMVAYMKGVRAYQQGKTERNLATVMAFSGLDRDTLVQSCWPTFRPDGAINLPSLLDFQTWAQGRGLVDSPVRADQLWEPRYVEFARRALGGP